MSRHRLVKNLNAEDIVSEFDGYDYEDEEDQLSPEDREAMANGTAEVRLALGTESDKVTTDQIQEALWHYYYDVDKSVTYLIKTYVAPPPKPAPKKVPEGEFYSKPLVSFDSFPGEVDGADRECLLPTNRLGNRLGLLPPTPQFPAPKAVVPLSWYFHDMPWFNIPKDRQTTFVEPPRPRGGLLGGGEASPKMSKLQAIAAARKKKTAEKKQQNKTIETTKQLSKLHLDDSQKENRPPGQGKRQRSIEEPDPQSDSQLLPPDGKAPDEASPTDDDMREPKKKKQTSYMDGYQAYTTNRGLPAAPSAFAQVLCGLAPKTEPKPPRQEFFPFPYTLHPSYDPSAFDEPSPDDIVLAAQAKAGKKPAVGQKAPKKSQKEKDIAKSISTLEVEDSPPPKSKGLDVLKEFENSNNKRSISFVVVGHVDAGKSTLMGRLLLELRYVEKHTIDRYRRQAEKSGKQSFALAWVMDQRSEERERGVTIDIATNHFETEKTNFTILDAPGHRDFVPNMIAGASQADVAIVVIDSDVGAYEKGLKGQTKEHILLLRSLGVQRLIIAVNKLDTIGWKEARFEEIGGYIGGFLTGLGFQSKNVTFVPISGLNGDNLVTRSENEAASWYRGLTLIETLEESEPSSTRALKKPFRMAISEVFRSQLGTTTIAGRVDAGSVQVGDAVLVQPSGEEAYVKSIMVDSEVKDWAVAGQNVSAVLSNIDPVHIRVGDMVCLKSSPINCSDTLTLKAMAFAHLMPMPVDLHRGRLHAAGQIQAITATLDKASGTIVKKKPRIVQPGGLARVVVKLASKVPLEQGQRVVIRSGGETIAAGLLE